MILTHHLITHVVKFPMLLKQIADCKKQIIPFVLLHLQKKKHLANNYVKVLDLYRFLNTKPLSIIERLSLPYGIMVINVIRSIPFEIYVPIDLQFKQVKNLTWEL